jgi:hypothetical protein
MTRYTIIRDGDGGFVVRVDDGTGWTRNSPRYRYEAEAEPFIVGHGQGTEYTVSRDWLDNGQDP